MPTYVYRCKSCLHEFEEFQKFSDDPLVECPSCKQKTLVRIISGSGLVFKGSGFYLTDYKNKSTSNSDTKSSDKKETKGESKEESKPASGNSQKTESKEESKPSSRSETKSSSKDDAKSPKPDSKKSGGDSSSSS